MCGPARSGHSMIVTRASCAEAITVRMHDPTLGRRVLLHERERGTRGRFGSGCACQRLSKGRLAGSKVPAQPQYGVWRQVLPGLESQCLEPFECD